MKEGFGHAGEHSPRPTWPKTGWDGRLQGGVAHADAADIDLDDDAAR